MPQVLIAEDNIANQKFLVATLKKLGLVADIANTGKEAVEAVTANHYDLVLMDCQMPEMNGFEAASEIRKRFAPEQLPIIAVTANAMPGDRERCLASGMNDYLAKPFSRSQLRAVMEPWLGS